MNQQIWDHCMLLSLLSMICKRFFLVSCDLTRLLPRWPASCIALLHGSHRLGVVIVAIAVESGDTRPGHGMAHLERYKTGWHGLCTLFFSASAVDVDM